MDFANLDKLENRITLLAEKILSLQANQQRLTALLEEKEKELVELHKKIKEFDATKHKINNRIESLLKKLEKLSSGEETQ